MSVFKTYDVRGVWGQGIDLALAYRLGRALPRHMKAKTFLIGYDARVHSAELYRALAAGLLDEGVKVDRYRPGQHAAPALHPDGPQAGGGGHGDRLPQPAGVPRVQGLRLDRRLDELRQGI